MKYERSFLRCKHCGNLMGVIEDSGVIPVCCGDKMTLLKANTSDGAGEKHVPVGIRKGNELLVKVGEVAHPMTEEHHISWIAVAQDGHTQRVRLDITDQPEARFQVKDGPVSLYEYCNLHGLWASEI